MKFNPFVPNGIAPFGMFAGRADELSELDKALFQTKNGNPRHFLIHGERGIGKSSLLLYLDLIAKGRISSLSDNHYKFVVVSVELDPTTTLQDLLRKISRELQSATASIEAWRSRVVEAWNLLKRIEACGISYSAPTGSNELIEDLCETIIGVNSRLQDECDGIVILIDEADKGAENCMLGEFLKFTTERLSRKGCNRVAFGISGLTTVISMLNQSHESSLRILNTFELKPLEIDERKDVVRRGLHEAEAKSGTSVTIDPEAEDFLARYSEGYPHFIQQYASSAFDTDNDNRITLQDVTYAMHKENGALDQLGKRYFESMYLDKIQSDDYRAVLRVMALHQETWVRRQDIKEATGLAESTLGSALKALKNREIIVAQRGTRGYFRLPTDSFGAWIRARMTKENAQASEKAF